MLFLFKGLIKKGILASTDSFLPYTHSHTVYPQAVYHWAIMHSSNPSPHFSLLRVVSQQSFMRNKTPGGDRLCQNVVYDPAARRVTKLPISAGYCLCMLVRRLLHTDFLTSLYVRDTTYTIIMEFMDEAIINWKSVNTHFTPASEKIN